MSTPCGLRIEKLETNCVFGVLKPQGIVRVKSLFGLIEKDKEKPALFIGNLWLDDAEIVKYIGCRDMRRVFYDSKWVFQVYGKTNVPEASQLVREIIQPFDSSIDLLIQSEDLRFEEKAKLVHRCFHKLNNIGSCYFKEHWKLLH